MRARRLQLEAELEWLLLIEPAFLHDLLLLLHEVNTIFLWEWWATLISSDLGHSIHVCFHRQVVRTVLKVSGSIFDPRCAVNDLSWLVKLACTVKLDF